MFIYTATKKRTLILQCFNLEKKYGDGYVIPNLSGTSSAQQEKRTSGDKKFPDEEENILEHKDAEDERPETQECSLFCFYFEVFYFYY